MRAKRVRLLVAALVVTATLPAVSRSQAATTVYIFTRGYGTAAGNTGSELVVRTVPIVAGTKLTLVNTQLWGHSITSDAWASENVRLFRSDVIPFGRQAEVVGVDRLAPGSYGFFCANHIHMRGSIVVLPEEE